MDGVINIIKPPGMTSMDVIAFMRKIVCEKKGGHIGTLDPGVSGVLPLFFGKATRAIHYVQDGDKIYRGEMTLGISTDTQDSEGEVVSSTNCSISVEQILQTINEFIGTIYQLPPMFSAIKINGEKLVDLARQGESVDRELREVQIFKIDVLNICREDGLVKVIMDIHCSRGTYIRTLFHDIGEKLGCGAHMSFLERIASGKFKIEDAVTFDEVINYKNNDQLECVFKNVSSCFLDLPRINLTEDNKMRLLNGIAIRFKGKRTVGFNSIYAYNGEFIGIGKVIKKPEEDLYLLKLEKQFIV